MQLNEGTIREALSSIVESFERIDCVVCTTFSFTPTFFENNILPILCRCEGVGDESLLKTTINQALSEIQVEVYFDPSSRPVNGGGDFDYKTIAVWHKKNKSKKFFHPKCIVVSGFQHAVPVVSILCGSANLTQKGWGSNCESFGILNIVSKKQQAFKELKLFLEYLKDAGAAGSNNAVRNLFVFMDKIKEDAASEDEPEFYFSGVHDSFLNFMETGRGVQREALAVISPYWGNVGSLLNNYLDNLNLIPAVLENGKYGIPLEDEKRISDGRVDDKIALMKPKKDTCKGETYRLWHAKAYLLWCSTSQEGSLTKIAVGSANCTNNGLGGRNGNIETMLVFQDARSKGQHKEKVWDAVLSGFEEVKKSEMAEFQTTEDTRNGVPTHPPFEICVIYNWLKREYSVSYEPDTGTVFDRCELVLPGLKQIINLVTAKKKLFTADHPGKKGRMFKLLYRCAGMEEEDKYEGIITEINARTHGTREFEPESSFGAILDEWDSGIRKSGKSKPRIETGAVGGREAVDDVNMFRIFKAMSLEETAIAKAAITGRWSEVKRRLYLSPSSFRAFAEKVSDLACQPADKYMLICECEKIFDEYKEYRQLNLALFVAEIKKKLRALRLALKDELLNDPLLKAISGKSNDEQMFTAFELCEWFRENIRQIKVTPPENKEVSK